MNERAVVEALARARVLPVVAIDHPSVVGDLCGALLAGGISCIEITFRTSAAEEAISAAAAVDGMLVGAGTVLTPDQARAAAAAGAAFAVAPGSDDDVADACGRLELPFFPGIATPTELARAVRFGHGVVKVFPAAQLGGPPFLRAIAATFPDVRFIPTGGIDEASLSSYLAVPHVLACGGSWIADRAVIGERRFDEVTRRARTAVEAVA
ncbi:MAG: bifunctional 4-hydroxy-2-oxoglutarate aldolase/2-dehydro-3-deoxy-phosphogluconate aldolase [Gaiellaceae bacterium]